MKTLVYAFSGLVAIICLTSCGQKGALYLPADHTTKKDNFLLPKFTKHLDKKAHQDDIDKQSADQSY
ncbi:lipoprotein [Moraxella nasovis]|uniref:LPS translocon maturation chaperone LptM n=1 Tax=Moraxella nasovis TaxID=2904121 RepID=UPI001F6192E7|nr:lipoprotein [Moraxella nasovis]UNU72827.1 lipoprotein [Moraxella nasovis]